jgi:outer membrane protein TolC
VRRTRAFDVRDSIYKGAEMLMRTTRHRCSLNVWSHIAAIPAFLMCGTLLSAQDLGRASHERLLVPSREGRYVTLEQAQQVASQANTLMARLGELEVEAARQVRLATRADYFPKIGTVFTNLHFNKLMGEELALRRLDLTRSIRLLGQDQTFIAVNAIQPITPLFKVREAVAIAQADEDIARTKMAMAGATVAGAVEKNYFDLLVAQHEVALAEARVRTAAAGRLVASAAFAAARVERAGGETREAEKALDMSLVSIRELTASLNELLGWAKDTPLELELPAPLSERLSLQEAVGTALLTNADVIEAEQTVRKAEAASTLSRLDYIPDVAVIGGYAYQVDAVPALPKDFSYIGVIGTYNIFDFGKREHSVKARSAQLQMARTALELTRAKVAAAVKTTYLELERSRALKEVARGATGTTILDATHTGGVDVRAARAQMSPEMLRLEYQHRQAYARLKALMGQQ